MNTGKKLSRRDFLKLTTAVSLQAVVLGLLGYKYSTDWEMNWIDITQLSLKLPRLDPAFKGLKLVQISDFHLGQWLTKERLDEVIRLVLEQSPDYVLLTGDFVEYRPYKRPNEWATYEKSLEIIRNSFSTLSASRPTLAILGNHDHRVGTEWIQSALSDAGVTVLQNSVHTIQRGRSKLHFAAVDDVNENMDRFDVVLDALPDDGAAILLVHEPDFADVSTTTGRFDLQLSGHTHGGQIVLPLVGPPILPTMGRKYPSGLYHVNDMLVYTNRGVGVTTVNARFNCRPEITVFSLDSE
ncbi:MAG: metallophosphoesterase [Chloroflexota bacterium]